MNTDTAQELRRQYAARIDDDRIVAHLVQLAALLDRDRVRRDLPDVGAEHHQQHAALLRSRHPLAIALLGTLERIATVREHDFGTAKLCNARSRFECTVTSAHDEYVLSRILLGIDESIDHLR